MGIVISAIMVILAILFLIILVAAFQLYFSIQEFIRTWFSEEYIPIVNSLYYLGVVAGGISLIFAYIRGR
jgi:ABC-type sulfate transport system permease component